MEQQSQWNQKRLSKLVRTFFRDPQTQIRADQMFNILLILSDAYGYESNNPTIGQSDFATYSQIWNLVINERSQSFLTPRMKKWFMTKLCGFLIIPRDENTIYIVLDTLLQINYQTFSSHRILN